MSAPITILDFEKPVDEASKDIVGFRVALVTPGTTPTVEDFKGEGTYDANGAASFDLLTVPAFRTLDGTYEAFVVNVDDAGLVSEPASLEVVVDFVKPSAPVNLRAR